MDAQAALKEGWGFAWGMNLISRRGGKLPSQGLAGVEGNTLAVSI